MIERPSPTRTAVACTIVLLVAAGSARTARADEPPKDSPGSTPTTAPADVPPGAETPPPPVIDLGTVSPAAPVAPPPGAPPPAGPSWFDRAPLAVRLGQGAAEWSVTFYGFVETDFITDTTRSYGDSIGSALVARTDVYEGHAGRTQFSMRNTRIGLAFQSPEVGGLRPSAIIEGDFFGSQQSPPTGSESTYYDSPTFRIRHAYLKLTSDVVDVVAGQTYDVFGWQNYFFPCSAEFLGLPNQVFSRNAQLRLSHAFGADGPVTVDVAASAVRPAQRDAQIPDGDAGVRLSFNGWKGITTPGNVRTVALPLSIGVSGTVRQFKVNAFTPPPAQGSNNAYGWGLSVDALVPIVPAADANDRANRLTLTGSFVLGTGIADLLTTGGGAMFPTLPNPAQASPPPQYAADIDNGLVTFDTQGVLHTINWQAFKVGLQWYLPPSGRLLFSANYTQSHSDNMAKLFPRGGAEIELLGAVANTSRYGDANLFWDATPAVRLGLSGQYTQVQYLDGDKPHNIRGMGQAVYVF